MKQQLPSYRIQQSHSLRSEVRLGSTRTPEGHRILGFNLYACFPRRQGLSTTQQQQQESSRHLTLILSASHIDTSRCLHAFSNCKTRQHTLAPPHEPLPPAPPPTSPAAAPPPPQTPPPPHPTRHHHLHPTAPTTPPLATAWILPPPASRCCGVHDAPNASRPSPIAAPAAETQTPAPMAWSASGTICTTAIAVRGWWATSEGHGRNTALHMFRGDTWRIHD